MIPQALDGHFMARAIELARRGCNTTMPNPRVGCVVVNNGVIVGEGWHERAGQPHAEVHALRMAGSQAKGGTAYVTLEPCSHYGRTPPCAEALKVAGIARVVVAMQDNNPVVAGSGLAILHEAGIAVSCGVLQEEARALNEGFFQRMATGIPLVRAKLAMSLDGRTAMSSGESKWITGAPARSEVQRLRAQSCAVMTGVGSILRDDSALTVREPGLVGDRQPLRVVLDSQLQTPVDARVVSGPGRCLIVTTSNGDARKKVQLEQAGAEVWVQSSEHRVNLNEVLAELGRRQCNEVLLETGAHLAGAMLAEHLLDELIVFMAPVLMGSTARPLFHLPLQSMAEKRQLVIKDIRAVGDDWKITARPDKG